MEAPDIWKRIKLSNENTETYGLNQKHIEREILMPKSKTSTGLAVFN
jgi:hypothetical protein